MPLTARITTNINVQSDVQTNLGTTQNKANRGQDRAIQDGTGSGQANKQFNDRRTLAASASENLDLAGVLLDATGAAITFTAIKAIYIRADAANTNDVIVGNAATNTFVGPFGAATHTITLKPGEEFLVTNLGAGWSVAAGTGDLLKVLNSAAGSSVIYEIILIGV